MNGNILSTLILLLWPLLAVWIYKKNSREVAALAVIMVPYMILPVKAAIDLPALPPIDKTSIAAISAILIFHFLAKDKLDYFPKHTLIRRMLMLLFIFPVFTVLTNMDALVYGPRVLPSLGVMDYVNIVFDNATLIYIPFVLGATYFGTEKAHRLFLLTFISLGLVYCLLIMWEIRMSPQLHKQVYGYFPHDFAQMKRQGGFRAVVFMGHGLLVAMFLAMIVLAVGGWLKAKGRRIYKAPVLLTFLYVLFLLVYNKSLGSLLLCMLALPMLLFLSRRLQLFLASLIAACVFIFPFIRAEFLPMQEIVAYFEGIDPERAQSLEYRVDNEDALLEKAAIRPVFGWGSWGRNRLYDPLTGANTSTTDGYWIITYGKYGWCGYMIIFGLISFPIYYLYRASKKSKIQELAYPSVAMALMLMINLVDQIPNDSANTLTFILAGALYARARELERAASTA